ncbi:glutathione S-transferase N-terminal domain-containing protein [Allohahella marinimesophila]|uniref:GST N-terminal domain-containing protein n=1 Tax=Allohahella marinimesophila TaxID=1054972 RepID=A0ABP7Q2U3_9GAMM
MIKLYQFPISHYCEKARWALDFKGVPYQVVNLIPGLHVPVMKRLTGRTSVPVLADGDTLIAGSDRILDYLDQAYPQPSLMPADAEQQQAVREWEAFADKDIGPHVRRYCYHTLLNHPDIVKPFFTTGGPWYGGLFLRAAFPALRIGMRKAMNINEAGAKRSLDKIVTAVALLAPLCRPEGYGLDWPEELPEPLASTTSQLAPKLAWVLRVYDTYRRNDEAEPGADLAYS